MSTFPLFFFLGLCTGVLFFSSLIFSLFNILMDVNVFKLLVEHQLSKVEELWSCSLQFVLNTWRFMSLCFFKLCMEVESS